MKVHVLPAEVVDRIAAGEVVERPANLVKELVENSIDAGAKRIEVAIAAGGRDVLVIDDGVGMVEEDLLLAVTRHATSKLGSVEDLWRVATLGFRGEALAAIAAVSRLEIRTRAAEELTGRRLVVEGGQRRLLAETAHAVGTEVHVADLFYNTPARLEFLKRPETETARAVEAVERLALARPDIAFRVTVEGRLAFRTTGSGNRLDALADLWGIDLAASLLAAEAEEGGVAVHLLLGRPGDGRPSRSHQHFFVNGRPVQAQRLRYALEEAYRERLMKGRHPIFVADLVVPPGDVDPNVHPQKLEVRLREEGRIAGLLHRTAQAALSPRGVRAPTSSPAVRAAEVEGEEATARLMEPRLSYGGDGPALRHPPEPGAREVPRVLGQAGGLYLVAESSQGLYLVDQHAAHERVRYEALARNGGEAQALLMPMLLRLSAEEMAVALARQAELEALGLQLEPIGEREVAVRSVPRVLGREYGAGDVHAALARLAGGGADAADVRRALIACRGAVKAGDALSLPEMQAVVAALFHAEEPRHCPHGRPTFLFFPFDELEARFGRR